MEDELSNLPPRIAADPEAELAVLIERAVQLDAEGLEVCKRIRELNEQISQRRRVLDEDKVR
jgi:hypothetical protein